MWEFLPPKVQLRGSPRLDERDARQLLKDYEDLRAGLPIPLEPYILSKYGIDFTSYYGGLKVKNPFGKASGQLSLARHQVEKDAAAGLGFVVLKTVIAQNGNGEQTMREWAIPETRMLVERIRARSGERGWTVTWKGRGWFDTFDAYRVLLDESLKVGKVAGMLVAPSVKYHLPNPNEDLWNSDEYMFTTQALVEVWSWHHPNLAMPLEKDFSPTLAGSSRAAQQIKILEWVRTVPGLIHRAALGKVLVGLKIFNTLFEDSFQLRMLEAVHESPAGDARADFIVYANRLFDPVKQFESKVGVAYGGPDLSDRNLAVLEQFLAGASNYPGRSELLPCTATGDILSGRTAAEYLLRGGSTFQMHTIFQLPDGEFAMKSGSKTEKVLHHLIFHPEQGFLAWLLDLRERLGWNEKSNVNEIAVWCSENWKEIVKALSE